RDRRLSACGGRPLRRLGWPYRPPGRGVGNTARVDPDARRYLSAGNRRLSRPRLCDHARGGARAEPLPRRAARGAHGVSRKCEAARGTYDVLPAGQPLRQLVTDAFEELCALYGYRKIQTPVFEDTELFARTAGESSDVVRKEMYTFVDRGDRSLTLRA